LVPKYRIQVDHVLCLKQEEDPEFFDNMFEILEFKEYDQKVWQDETHAFLVDLGHGCRRFYYGRDFKMFRKQLKAKKVRLHFKYNKIAKELTKIYKHYLEEYNDKEKTTTTSDVLGREDGNAQDGSESGYSRL